MAKLRPVTPEHLISAEPLHGSPRSTGGEGWEPDGLGYGKPRALTENSSGLPPADGISEAGEVFPRDARSSSLRTEPDMDTIMPLRHGTNQMANVVSPASSEEDYLEGVDGAKARGRREYQRLSSEFTTVEHPLLESDFFEGDLTAQALAVCKRTVLHPYYIFLKLVGWRKLRISQYDLEPPLWQRTLNTVWPSLICLFLLTSCATQIITCFRRDQVQVFLKNGSDGLMHYHVRCERHILTSFVIPDLLLFSAFIYGLYIFRWAQTEQLTTLTEAVFLGIMSRSSGRYCHKRLTRTLQLMMVIGIAWVVFSFSVNVFRIPSLHLLDTNTQIQWIPSYRSDTNSSNLIERWVFVVVTLLGFVVMDMAYAAVVINYSIQCQLLVFLFCSICERIRAKDWDIERTIKELKSAREFLSMLNSHLSRAVSLLLFIFLTTSVKAIWGLQSVRKEQDFILEVTTGLLSIVQWTFMLVLPLIQASRVTRAAARLKKVGLEVRSRPYSYLDTPQLDLDSLVLYTTSLKMSAKLVNVPISPSVVGVLFFIVGFVLFLVFQFDTYHWAVWL